MGGVTLLIVRGVQRKGTKRVKRGESCGRCDFSECQGCQEKGDRKGEEGR